MKYVRYSFAGFFLLMILLWDGHWIFAKEHIGSPFASPLMVRGSIMWGALAAGLLANTWKKRFAFAALGGFGAWALLHLVYMYHLHRFPAP